MALAKVWDEEFSPREEYGQHLSVLVAQPRVLRTGVTVHRRRAARARMLRRRRRSALLAGLALSLVILAWPGHAFGGVTASGVSIDHVSGAELASGMVYVVQPGDTVLSIAKKVNPWSPAEARRALVHELGTSAVVAGEHVVIP